MATLLHIDSSLNGDNSASRAVTALYREVWESEHPEGKVVYRDLAADPIPHVDALTYYAGYVAPEDRTPEQREAYALNEELISELENADAILIGAPMYNYSIPSTLKAWLDRVIAVGRTSMTANPSAAGKPVTVVTSRGGSYAPGTPQEGNDFVEPYLRHVLGNGLGLEVDFIVPELTLAPSNPGMAELVPLFEKSRDLAQEQARSKAAALAARLTA
ncbi:FMN-dependent NADH-azoreductase [Streptomyces alkaliterrae]|uniref:FMN dependent NADH:quinone oxidoreductase n=1 Tax=Streptomyces alkaliterrae TaxID=2213162 RepID=A0A5P0YQP1_9ACTN|nr:NAD(P)H-dependent oxidoreductase [Streptomyces alkaliterrae]MBB1253773.1 NAD(P)H-dependent oxidoreductase [Streptomyces alkaliterrae]MBB1258404.1 NAD(P)H-dependent oxidoreductase [Streptomyces alkaliterrae]MQS02230.1 FMN-dependent NADH-azoreductase [Streptomyces alkaliterrae]